MKGHLLLSIALVLSLPLAMLAQSPTDTLVQVDAGAEVSAALFAASATQVAAEQLADAKIRAQRIEIEGLRAKVRAGD